MRDILYFIGGKLVSEGSGNVANWVIIESRWKCLFFTLFITK